MSNDKLNFNNTVNAEGEWFINEDLDLPYFSVLAFDSVLSDTSFNVNSGTVSTMHSLPSLHAPMRSSFMTYERASDAHRPFSKCQPNRRVKSQSYLGESSLSH